MRQAQPASLGWEGRSEAAEEKGGVPLKEGRAFSSLRPAEEKNQRDLPQQRRGPWGSTTEHLCSPDRQGEKKVRGLVPWNLPVAHLSCPTGCWESCLLRVSGLSGTINVGGLYWSF